MTQASILKVTANGTTTSPVVRGAWIMERMLGKPPPPPPKSVPAVEPDTRGNHHPRAARQTSHDRKLQRLPRQDRSGRLRARKFRRHGRLRDRYRALGNGPFEKGIGKNGQKFVFHAAQPIDPSGELPPNLSTTQPTRIFKDVRELKTLLLKDQRQIARNLVQQLVTYATGAPVRFGDRAGIERILDRTAADKFPCAARFTRSCRASFFGISDHHTATGAGRAGEGFCTAIGAASARKSCYRGRKPASRQRSGRHGDRMPPSPPATLALVSGRTPNRVRVRAPPMFRRTPTTSTMAVRYRRPPAVSEDRSLAGCAGDTVVLPMPLDIGLAGPRPGPPSAEGPVVKFYDCDKDDDDTGGYYWFLHPLFHRLAEKTGQYIDLYGDAEFRGDDLQLFREILVEARQLV